jgi:hypothetical protein
MYRRISMKRNHVLNVAAILLAISFVFAGLQSCANEVETKTKTTTKLVASPGFVPPATAVQAADSDILASWLLDTNDAYKKEIIYGAGTVFATGTSVLTIPSGKTLYLDSDSVTALTNGEEIVVASGGHLVIYESTPDVDGAFTLTGTGKISGAGKLTVEAGGAFTYGQVANLALTGAKTAKGLVIFGTNQVSGSGNLEVITSTALGNVIGQWTTPGSIDSALSKALIKDNLAYAGYSFGYLQIEGTGSKISEILTKVGTKNVELDASSTAGVINDTGAAIIIPSNLSLDWGGGPFHASLASLTVNGNLTTTATTGLDSVETLVVNGNLNATTAVLAGVKSLTNNGTLLASAATLDAGGDITKISLGAGSNTTIQGITGDLTINVSVPATANITGTANFDGSHKITFKQGRAPNVSIPFYPQGFQNDVDVSFRKFDHAAGNAVTVLGFDLGSKKNVVLPWTGTVTLDGDFNNAGNLYLGSTSTVLEGGTLKGAGAFYYDTPSSAALALVDSTNGITGTAFGTQGLKLYGAVGELASGTATLLTGTSPAGGGGGTLVITGSHGPYDFSGLTFDGGTDTLSVAGTAVTFGASSHLGAEITGLEFQLTGTGFLASGTSSVGTTASSQLVRVGAPVILKTTGVKNKNAFPITGTVRFQ